MTRPTAGFVPPDLGDLRTAVAAGIEHGERERRLAPDVVAAAESCGWFASVTPTSLGGRGGDLGWFVGASRDLARVCPASAWVLSFLALHGWLLSRLPDARDELYADGIPLAPASLAPTGQAVAVDGGHRVSGTWGWATGVRHGEWVMVHAIVPEAMESRFFVVRRREAEVLDDWHSAGMRATGSSTVVLREVVVPAHRSIPAMEVFGTDRPAEGDGFAGLPVIATLALVAATPSLGAADAAVDFLRDRIASRIYAYTLADQARDDAAAQIRLATATAEARTLAARWRTAVDGLCGAARAGSVDIEHRIDARLAASGTVQGARRLIGTIGEGVGGSAYLSSSPFQRLQRDVETMKGHAIFDWDRTARLAGRHLLGLELEPTEMV